MKKKLAVALVAAVAIVMLVLNLDIKSVEDYYLEHIDDITPDSATVFLSVNCGTILDNYDDLDAALREGGYVPENGVILNRTEYVLREGDTPYTILERAAKYNRIQLEYSGIRSAGSLYIRGISNIYEFSCGPLSGWQFAVNGDIIGVGADSYTLRDGDLVEWIYTCDLGRDLYGYEWRSQ